MRRQETSPGWRDVFPDMGVFMDWASIHQKDPALFDASETPEAKPEGRALLDVVRDEPAHALLVALGHGLEALEVGGRLDGLALAAHSAERDERAVEVVPPRLAVAEAHARRLLAYRAGAGPCRGGAARVRHADPANRTFNYTMIGGARFLGASAARLLVVKFLAAMNPAADVMALANLALQPSEKQSS